MMVERTHVLQERADNAFKKEMEEINNIKPPIEFREKNINDLIAFWREKVIASGCDEEKLIAMCYVDAYQSVRINHGLELLPERNK